MGVMVVTPTDARITATRAHGAPCQNSLVQFTVGVDSKKEMRTHQRQQKQKNKKQRGGFGFFGHFFGEAKK
jgi:hypothetical protein